MREGWRVGGREASMSEQVAVPVLVIDDSVARYVRWFAAACFGFGCLDTIAIAGSMIYVASLGALLDPRSLLTQDSSWWLVEEALRVWGLLLLIGGWAMLRAQEWGRVLLLIWALGDAILTVVYFGYWVDAYTDPTLEWAMRAQGWLHLPADLCFSMSGAVAVYLFLTRPGVRAAIQPKAFEVTPIKPR